MWLGKFGWFTERAVNRLSLLLVWIACGMLAMIMFLNAGDVVGRVMFDKPVEGTKEISELIMALMVFCGLAYNQIKKGNVQIDLVTSHLSTRIQGVIDSGAFFLCGVMAALMSWQAILNAQDMAEEGRITIELGLPLAPFLLVVAGSSALLAVVFLIDAIHSLTKGMKG